MPGKIRRRPEPPEFIMRHVDDVPLTFLTDPADPNSARVKENFSLDFKSFTAYGFLKMTDELNEEMFTGTEHYKAAILARMITAIVDSDKQPLTDEAGAPAKLTAAFFMGLLDEDREAIQAAIKADANPPKPTSPSGAFGSNPEETAA